MIPEDVYLESRRIVDEYEKQLNGSVIRSSFPKVLVHYKTYDGCDSEIIGTNELAEFEKKYRVLSVTFRRS